MSTTPMSTSGTDAATRPPGPLPEEQPRGDRHDHDLRVAEHRRQPGADLLDGVVPQHEVDGEEDARDPGQASLPLGAQAESAALEPGQQEERRQGVGAAEDRGRGRRDVGQAHEDRREGDGQGSQHGGQDRPLAEEGEEGAHRSKPSRRWLPTLARATPHTAHSAPMPELLTGTVTFFFSDIEGSTRLLRTCGDRWPADPRAPSRAAASRVRGERRQRGRHRGRLVLRRLPDGAGRGRGRGRRPTGAGGRGVAGRRGGARPHRPPHRRGQPVGKDLRRPPRPPGQPHRERRSRRAGAAVGRDPLARAGCAARRRRAARPRRASAQGSRASRAHLAARHRRAAERLPRDRLARRHAEQPAHPADDVPRPRRGDRRHRLACWRITAC